MSKILSEYLFYYFTLSTLLRFFLIMIFSHQEPVHLAEKRVRSIVQAGILADLMHLLLILMFSRSLSSSTIHDFLYFNSSFRVLWTSYSISFFLFAQGLILITARFSVFYLHRDQFIFKFFALLSILQLATVLLILTSSSTSLFIGWELMGLCSILLIAFYDHRPAALKNSLIIMVIYKIADLLFYSALIFSAYYGSSLYTNISNFYIVFLILLACLIKSSLFPFVWLPRAMEGPTPSSAIFYGGIATHVPIYIFLNIYSRHPFTSSRLTLGIIIYLLLSAFLTSLMSRRANDAKSAIALASTTQINLIYIEILLGWFSLAIVHSIVNGIYRSFEFLKSPSLIYQYHHLSRKRRNHQPRQMGLVSRLLPQSWNTRFYRWAFHEFYLPVLITDCISGFLGLANTRPLLKTLRTYVLICLSLFCAFELIVYSMLHIPLDLIDEVWLGLALGFNIIAYIYKFRPWLFFMAMLCSTLSVFTVLLYHIHPMFFPIGWSLLLGLVYLIIRLIREGIPTGASHNFTGRFFKSTTSNVLILIVGISVIGVPGLFSFIIWERLEHVLLPIHPDLILDGFFIFALNTILFFRFYYANFLGKSAPVLPVELIKRV